MRIKGKMKAPLFCVPLRLYRLVSPVHDQHLCLFQKLQTQSPESTTLAIGRETKEKEKMDTHTEEEEKGREEKKGERGEKTGVGEQQSRVVSSQIN